MPRTRSARPRTRPPASDSAAVADRRTRAVEEALDVRLRSAEPYPLLEVRNPVHGTLYLVMLPEFPGRDAALCTCTDFARRGLGTCKHIEAGFRWLTGHPDARPLLTARPASVPSPTLWRQIDQRISASARAPGPASLRWRRAGAVLYEGVEE